MRVIRSTQIDDLNLDNEENLWLYNGLDCALTREIYDALQPQVAERCQHTYNFERGMVACAINLMLRGWRIDEPAVEQLVAELEERQALLQKTLDRFAEAVWDKPLNINSPVQLKKIFYEVLAIPPSTKNEKGKIKVTTDRSAMEQIAERYPRGRPLAVFILAIRDIGKKLSVLKSNRDKDGRMRCSYNVAGTETGRWSSSSSPFDTGTNLQNVTKDLRKVFIPDEGYVLFNADLEQAESRVVAYLSGDENYIEACEGGDLHTTVVKMIWPHLPWTGNLAEDKALAESPYYRQFSYRDICKRAGHGTNYGLAVASLARHLRLHTRYAALFQARYYGAELPLKDLERWHKQDKEAGFDQLIDEAERLGPLCIVGGAFPGIRQWHTDTIEELETTLKLTTPFGRTRYFFGRANDATTHREAIAYVPQSTIGDLLNVGLYRIWNELERGGRGVRLFGQVHDSVVGQLAQNKIDTLCPAVLECLTNPLVIGGRTMVVPSEILLGHNWKDLVKPKEWRP